MKNNDHKLLLDEIIKLVKKYPNDMELGKEVRKEINKVLKND